jgi:ribosomal protein S27AE
MFVDAVVAAVVLGYLAGLVSFKVKNRWCPECGATTASLKQRR